MNEGYIKLFRSLTEWEWYSDTNTTRLWIHILLTANWKLGRFKGQEVYAGELITSLRHLAEQTGLSVQNVRTALTHLKSTHEITTKTTSQYTLIRVEKWRFFQVDECIIDNPFNTPPNKQLTTI